jgi:ribonuclease P protein subunit RPR2
MQRRTKPEWQQKIAKERIEILFKEAKKIASKDSDLANRYVFLARKLGMKYGVRLPKDLKMKFCHHCYHYFYSKNLKVKVNPKTKAVEYNCKDCGKITRYGYSSKKKSV